MIPSKVALTIFALQGVSSGVIDQHCSAAENLSMSQPTQPTDSDDEQSRSASQPSLKRVFARSTGWFMQGVTGIDQGYLSILKEAETQGIFWNEATASVCSGLASVTEGRITLAQDVKAGDLFDDFRGHWMPIGVDSPVEGIINSWPATRLLLSWPLMKKLDFVSSVPQAFDYVKRTVVLSDANVCMFAFEDEVNGHIVFKSQFIKDTKEGEEITWWVPDIQAQGRAVRIPIIAVEKRQQCNTSWRRGSDNSTARSLKPCTKRRWNS